MMAAGERVALLWDIDGTLLSTARAGIVAWERALSQRVGSACSLEDWPTAGVTDRAIARQLLVGFGLTDDPAAIASLVADYETLLPECLPLRRGRVLPNVREILTAIVGRPDVVSSLLTGNTRRGAEAKLRHYGLMHFFDGGAFAEDGESRDDIARAALVRVREQAVTAVSHVIVIGDTPHDIRCAKAIGARAVAVATGAYESIALRDHAPWQCLEFLPDPVMFMAMLGSDGSARP